MAVKEKNTIIRTIDENGDSIIMYPATTKDNITDLEEATTIESGLLSSQDKSKLNKVTYVLGSDENGVYMESL